MVWTCFTLGTRYDNIIHFLVHNPYCEELSHCLQKSIPITCQYFLENKPIKLPCPTSFEGWIVNIATQIHSKETTLLI